MQGAELVIRHNGNFYPTLGHFHRRRTPTGSNFWFLPLGCRHAIGALGKKKKTTHSHPEQNAAPKYIMNVHFKEEIKHKQVIPFQVPFKLQTNVLQYGEDSPVSIRASLWWWIFFRCCLARDMCLIDFTLLLFGALDRGPCLESADGGCPLVLRRRASYNYVFLSMILCDRTESSYLFSDCGSNHKSNALIQQQLPRGVSPFSYLR